MMKKRRSHLSVLTIFLLPCFLSIKHSLHYEHIIIEKEIGLHFSSASIAAPISACWILSNKIKARYTLIFFQKHKVLLQIIQANFRVQCVKFLSNYFYSHILNCIDWNIQKGLKKCHLFAHCLLSYLSHIFNTVIKCLPFILGLKYFLLNLNILSVKFKEAKSKKSMYRQTSKSLLSLR